MKVDRLIRHIKEGHLHAAGENVGNELPRCRVDTIREARAALARLGAPDSFPGGEYVTALRDVLAAYEAAIEGIDTPIALRDDLKTAIGFMIDCGVCMLPATYERGLCYVCDKCQASAVAETGVVDDPSYGARELRQASLVRRVTWVDDELRLMVGCIGYSNECGCNRCSTYKEPGK